jgi:gliding motility-associated-like protein
MGIKEYEYPMTYTWNDATHLNNANHPNPITTIQFPFNFELYITDGTCTDTILQHVNIEGLSDELELVASEDTVDQYETVLIKLNLFYDFDDTLIWNNYDITEVPQGVLGFTSNSLEETTTFSAIAILAEDSNCTLPLSKTVYIRPYTCDQDSIFVANGFTPNNDGLNDVVNVAHPSFTIRTFDVFDRYGNKVYEIPEEGSHHLFPWDGIYKDMKLEPGAYVYYLEGDCNGAFSKQGNITLIR